LSILIIISFVLGYVAIAFEHPLRVNKAASALITGVLCWTVYMLQSDASHEVGDELLHHLGEIASILFFLLGAMTIVELIDSHNGFDIITQKIKTTSKQKLLLIIATLTFFLSALLDNLTTAIVMTSLCSKILSEKEDRLWFAGMIIIAANADGAWSPLGDVTTTMLWIGGQITALNIMKQLILPSLAACIIPALIISYRFKGKKLAAIPASTCTENDTANRIPRKNKMLGVSTATSHFILAIMALAGTIVHIYQGNLKGEFTTILSIGAGVIIGAQFGALYSQKIKPHWIVRSLAVALLLVGVRLLFK